MSKVNIKQVAETAGVSTATVSRVLNSSGYASDELRSKVMDTVKALNYRPSAIARSLKQDKTYTIGVIIPDISNPYFMQLAKGLEDVVYPNGYHLIFSSSDGIESKEKHLLKMMYEKRTDIIILAVTGKPIEILQEIVASGTPIITADRYLIDDQKKKDLYIKTFIEDNCAIAKEVTELLIRQGHKRIGIVHGGNQVSTSKDRLEGIRRAFVEHQLKSSLDMLYDGGFTEQGGVEAADYFMKLDQPPTAIFALNNQMATGVLLKLRELGIMLPRQVKLASYGEIEAARLLPSLKVLYVQQNPYRMGQLIGRYIIENQLRQESDIDALPSIQYIQPSIIEL